MFELGLPEFIVILVILVIISAPAVIVVLLIMTSGKSRRERQLRHGNGLLSTYCTQCGQKLIPGSSFCHHYDAKLPDVDDAR